MEFQHIMTKKEFKERIKNYSSKERNELIDFLYDCIHQEISIHKKEANQLAMLLGARYSKTIKGQ